MSGRVLALSGGIGGAKLALGLYRIVAPDALTVVANPGDDFEHLGLTICPDLDTLVYTLAGLADVARGWGREGETWSFMAALEDLGGETWFSLGDGDLAMHVERTRRLRGGEGLTALTADLCRRLGVRAEILPATDDPVRTIVETAEGADLAFQHYFVRDACAPRVRGFRFAGAARALPQARVLEVLADAATELVVLCPSNPYISIDPILALPGVRAALAACAAPVVAVAPVIGEAAVKGPTAKMMAELGRPVSALTVARHYAGLLDGYVLDEVDAALAADLDVPCLATGVLMRDEADKRRLAGEVLEFGCGLRAGANAPGAAR